MIETIYEARIEIPEMCPFVAYCGPDVHSVWIVSSIIEWCAKQVTNGTAVIIDPTGYKVHNYMATQECDQLGLAGNDAWFKQCDKVYKRFEFRRK